LGKQATAKTVSPRSIVLNEMVGMGRYSAENSPPTSHFSQLFDCKLSESVKRLTS